MVFKNIGYACAIVVYTWADRHLLQLLMELIDTLAPQKCIIVTRMKEIDYE